MSKAAQQSRSKENLRGSVPRDHLSPENVSGTCSLMRAMSFSLGYRALCSVTKILATGKDGVWPSLSEPALTFQLDTSRYFLWMEMARSGGRQSHEALPGARSPGLLILWKIIYMVGTEWWRRAV